MHLTISVLCVHAIDLVMADRKTGNRIEKNM